MAVKAGWEDLGNNLVRNTSVYGGVVDQNNPYYTNYKEPSQTIDSNPVARPSGGQITSAGDVTKTAAPVGSTTAQGAPTTVAQSFQQALINRMNPTAVGTSSPEIAPAIQANKLAEQRGFENNRALLAERAAANGQDLSGGFETNLLGLAQDRAGREGQFAGNAVQRANELQQQNLTSALGMTGNLLTGNANRDQQQTLAELDAAIRREGLGAQTALGQGDLALRGRLGESQLNLGLLQALLGNQQFGQGLAQQGAQFGAGLDQQGLIGLLGLL